MPPPTSANLIDLRPGHKDLPCGASEDVPGLPLPLPTHKDLPCEDGSIVENNQEHPLANLLTDSLGPRLAEVYGDGNFYIGADTGIFWRHTSPPLAGCKSPDWYVVPGVPQMLDGEIRRSYVLWQEIERPLLVAEFVSRSGAEERDRTPMTGKFWVYERGLAVPFYVIFDGFRRRLEVHHLQDGVYRPVEPNAHGRYPIPPLRIELGMWHATYRGITGVWLRAWDAATGGLLSISEERAALAEADTDHFQELAAEATEHADAERRRADDAVERLRLLEEKLRAAGLDA